MNIIDTKQLAKFGLNIGCSASLSVIATSDEPLAYRWYFTTTTNFGATISSYDITPVGAGDAGNYFFVASSAGGSATNALATLTVLYPPVITQPSASLAVCERFPATFNVAAADHAPISYQRRFNGTNNAGAEKIYRAIVR